MLVLKQVLNLARKKGRGWSDLDTPYSDQTHIFPAEGFKKNIHFIGCGGASNMAILTAASMGIVERCNIHLYDPDILEDRNIPTEVVYSYNSVGEHKVDAMLSALKFKFGEKIRTEDELAGSRKFLVGANVYLHRSAVDSESKLDGIVITGVDSMKSRKEIWEAIKKSPEVELLIDLRSAGLTAQVITVLMSSRESVEAYESSWLFSDSEAMELECGARNVGFISAHFGAEVGYILSLFAREMFDELDSDERFLQETVFK